MVVTVRWHDDLRATGPSDHLGSGLRPSSVRMAANRPITSADWPWEEHATCRNPDHCRSADVGRQRHRGPATVSANNDSALCRSRTWLGVMDFTRTEHPDAYSGSHRGREHLRAYVDGLSTESRNGERHGRHRRSRWRIS